jgi:putative ABC transport system substrate-binding protein
MRRRDFIALVGGVAGAWPLAARAQQTGKIARIGFLGSDPNVPLFATSYPAFLAELHKLGFNEGQNLIIEYHRTDEGVSEAFAGAAETIRSNVDVVVAFGPEIALKAAVAASQTTPIVMIAVNFDPIAGGYVSDLARPNKNITGLVYRAPELAAKQLELLVEAFPDSKSIAVLWESASTEQFASAQRTAQSLHIDLRSHKLENPPFDFRRGVPKDRAGRVAYGARLVRPNIRLAACPYCRLGDAVPSADDVHLQILRRGGWVDVLRY